MSVGGSFNVLVTAAEGSNVYINSSRGRSVTFAKIPDHGMLRIIVQEGDKAPQIYYLTLTDLRYRRGLQGHPRPWDKVKETKAGSGQP